MLQRKKKSVETYTRKSPYYIFHFQNSIRLPQPYVYICVYVTVSIPVYIFFTLQDSSISDPVTHSLSDIFMSKTETKTKTILTQGCIFRLMCSYPELTKDNVLTSAYVKIFRTLTRNAINKSVGRKKDCS